MVPRLRRLERVYPRFPIYFVTSCAEERKPILARPEVHEGMLRFAEAGVERGAWLGAFVLMPDHVHLFVALDETRLSLDSWVKSLKNSLSKALRAVEVASPHWQKGFFDHLLRSDESYREKWDYVRQNPVRAGLSARPEDWPYWAEPFPLQR